MLRNDQPGWERLPGRRWGPLFQHWTRVCRKMTEVRKLHSTDASPPAPGDRITAMGLCATVAATVAQGPKLTTFNVRKTAADKPFFRGAFKRRGDTQVLSGAHRRHPTQGRQVWQRNKFNRGVLC